MRPLESRTSLARAVARIAACLALALAARPAAAAVRFDPPVTYATAGYAYSVAIADLDGDGRLDLVVGHLYTDSVSVLLGNGDGTFQPRRDFDALLEPGLLAIGDLDGDGHPDLAVVGGASSDYVSVMLGHGDGTFAPPIQYAAGLEPSAVGIGDFNRDGRPDLATANAGHATHGWSVGVLPGLGGGAFGPAAQLLSEISPVDLKVADMNGDGKLDLVVANDGSGSVSIFLGNGDGTFQPGASWGAGGYQLSVAIGDFNGDGRPDVVTTGWTDSVVVLIGRGDGTLEAARGFAATWPFGVATGDLDGDGHVDVVTANYDSNSVSVLIGRGDGTFEPKVDFPAGNRCQNVAIADLNGDGTPDLAVACSLSGGVCVLLNRGAATVVGPAAGPRLVLAGFRPNPARGAPAIAFELASGAPATLDVIDVGGRRVLGREVGSLGPGAHVVDFGGARPAPGVYWLRLRQDGLVRSARGVILE